MDVMELVYANAKAAAQRVAFPEAENDKIQKAAIICKNEGYCVPKFVGNPEAIQAAAANFGNDISGIEIISNQDEEFLVAKIDKYLEVKKDAIFGAKSLKRRCADPIYLALILEAIDEVDVTFAGIDHTTGDVIMCGQTVVGLQEGVTTPSSSSIFKIPGYQGSEGELLGFGDSAVCVNPSSEDLASIAIQACDTTSALVGWTPRCAMLSYSTKGSANSELTQKVVDAVKIANERRPDLLIDGEFQLDAAIKPEVAAKKVKVESAVAGKANIIIWPDINVGNIGVKLVQTFGHADAYGPFLQGFAKIVCDCSRGAPVSELVGNIACSCVRAGALKK